MNTRRENLQRMADYIRTIPQEKFSMNLYRKSERKRLECDSIACVIGHCTILDTEENIDKFRDEDDDILFKEWSKEFTGLDFYPEKWSWCFDADWVSRDDTSEGAALRIEYLLAKGLPSDWKNQMYGRASLCYV